MLISNPIPSGEYRHNYIRLAFLIGTIVLFLGYIVVNQLAERGDNGLFPNTTLRAEELAFNDITPSDWVYQSLDAFNYLWQLSWLLYTLTFIYRRSTGGYLYVSPSTLTPKFYTAYIVGVLIQIIWLLFFHETYIIWSWIIYLLSFLLLSLTLFIINNNLALNAKLYETEGFSQDIWYLRVFAQNGVAFFACWTALRFVLAFNTFLQFKLFLSIVNAGTISLVLAAVLTLVFLIGTNFNATIIEKCAYQFSPWIVFIIFYWGVVENNWIPRNATRNNIIAAIELILTVISAILTLIFFSIRLRKTKVDSVA